MIVLKEVMLLVVPKLSMVLNVELKIVLHFGTKLELAWVVVVLFLRLFLKPLVALVLLVNVCPNIITVVPLQTTVVQVANLDLVPEEPSLLPGLLLPLLLPLLHNLVDALLDNVNPNMVTVVPPLPTVVLVANLDLVLEEPSLLLPLLLPL